MAEALDLDDLQKTNFVKFANIIVHLDGHLRGDYLALVSGQSGNSFSRWDEVKRRMMVINPPAASERLRERGRTLVSKLILSEIREYLVR